MRSTATRLSALVLFLTAAAAVASEPGVEPGAPPTTPAAPEPATGPTDESGKWHRLVGILQYLEADYPFALESKSEFEMAEQRAFITEAIAAAQDLGPAARAFVPRLQSIEARILKAEDPEGVSRDCGALIESLVMAGGLERSPRQVPDLARGAELYQQVCAACHAKDGSANVPAAASMEPPPANFLDPELMGGTSAYKAFNTISFGVKGTAMAPFAPAIDEKDRWALAFYVLSMRHPECLGEPPRASLEKLATATDEMLAAEFGADKVACLRKRPPQPDEEGALLVARENVERSMKLAAEGQSLAARQALLDAYLNGIEPVEPLLTARNPTVVARIEQVVLRMRVGLENNSPHVRDDGRELLTLIDEARRSSANTSVWAVFGMALLILLREGFEALVVIAALLAVLKRMQATAHARIVHAGWVSALIAGVVAFVFAQKLLAGANREWMEGLVALFAVVMLLYAAFWLNARANMSVFMKGLRAQMEGALGSGSMAGLFLISFSAVGRETFETALFLQGLSIDSPTGAAWGAVAGLVVLTVLVLVVSRVGYRLPMKLLFNASTIMLFATAVMLLGKGLHAMQEVGAVPIKPIPMFTVDALGIYPDAFSLIPQLLLALSPFAWKLVKRLRAGDETQKLDEPTVAPGTDA